MEKDQIFLRPDRRNSDFEFDSEVAEVFDDMLLRSVPFYAEQQRMINQIAKTFWIKGTHVYDLGCSTGNTLINLCREIDRPGQLFGYDNAPAMLERANLKIEKNGLADRIKVQFGDLNGNLGDLVLGNASLVIICWTLQFIRPPKRNQLIKWVYDGLVNDGALVVTEKILPNNCSLNRSFIDFYYDFKAANGYSNQEIVRKREALENVLVPYRIDENIDMLNRNGFEIVETFFQWYNFAGFLCVKKPLRGHCGSR